MPVRSFLLVALMAASLSGWSQQFTIDTCNVGCAPTLDYAPADADISCDAALPNFDEVTATACVESPVEAEIGLELTKSNGSACVAETAFGQGDDWALWFAGFEAQGYGASDNFVPTGDGLVFEQYANGTAQLSGEVRNDANPAQGFEVRIFLQFGQDYDAWTAQGRLYKDDLGTMNYPDWTYYEMVDTLSHLIGLDDMDGDVLYLDHMPVHRLFGFQVGEGANNRNWNNGLSGWFWYRGVIDGETVNGTGDVNVDLTECAPLGVACPVTERTQRVRFARGSCGHDYHIQTIDRVDTEAPSFDVVPELLVTSCATLPALQAAEDFQISDDCSGPNDITLEHVSDSVTGPACNQTLHRRWRATDACGHAADTVQVAAIVDTVGPVFDSAPTLDEASCTDLPPLNDPDEFEVSDECSESVTVEFIEDLISGPDCNQILNRVWRATDGCGNTTDYIQTSALVDTVGPVFANPTMDTTLICTDWDAFVPGEPEVSDACSEEISVTWSEPTIDGDFPSQFSAEFTVTATDACGNATEALLTVAVLDTAAPVVTSAPDDVVLACSMWPEYEVEFPEVEDDCDPLAGLAPTAIDTVMHDGDCDGSAEVELIFTYTDAAGNSVQYTAWVSLIDTVAPEFSNVPVDATLNCGDDLPEAMPEAEDACSGVVELALTIDTIAGDCQGEMTVIRTFTATDDCGNAATASQTLTVVDVTPPTFIQTPADSTIACGADLPSALPIATDICSEVTVTETVDSLAGDCDGSWNVTRTFTASDDCGNTAVASQTVWIIDTIAPVFVDFEAEVSVACGSEDTLMAVAADDCGPVIDISWTDTPADTGCVLPIGAYWRTYVATDACGNAAEATQLVLLTDDISPTFSWVPADTVIACGQSLPEDFATAEDNCSGASVSLEIVSTPDSCDGALIVERIFTATDNCGNMAIAVQTVQVTDTVAPEFTFVPADTTIACTADLPTDLALATDICSDVSLTVAVDSTQGDCPSEWTVTRTFTATDACGNAASAVQTVWTIDTVAPVFDLASLPADTALDCAADIPTCEDYEVLATDDCGEATVSCASETTPGACAGDYTTLLTFTATDVCGNASTYGMTITVTDVTAPVCTVCPADTVVSCESVPDPADPETFTVEEDCGTIEIELVQDDTTGTPCDYYVTRVWTFTDDCGNQSEHTQTLTVEDLTPPEIPAGLPALDFDCTFEVPRDTLAIVDTLIYEDNCTAFQDIWVGYEDLVISGDSTTNEYTLERIWTYIDQCGNVSMTTQEIVVDEPDASPELPTGLSPNDDGFNDTYYIAEIGPDPIHPPCYWAENVFTVFNRWGSLILEEPAYRNNWQGRTELGSEGEALPDGTYYVVFRVGLREFATFVDLRTQ